jgi:hypothetical protein
VWCERGYHWVVVGVSRYGLWRGKAGGQAPGTYSQQRPVTGGTQATAQHSTPGKQRELMLSSRGSRGSHSLRGMWGPVYESGS